MIEILFGVIPYDGSLRKGSHEILWIHKKQMQIERQHLISKNIGRRLSFSGIL